MSKYTNVLTFLLRIALGWLFFYSGITKVVDPEWSAGGFLKGANTLSGFYGWLASDAVLPFTNFLNEWGLTLLGASLILGALVRLSAPLGAAMMLLYYIPGLTGLMPDAHSFIVDEHIVYIFTLLLLAALHAGRMWGLDKKLSQIPTLERFT
jgi:thiosulfate dehydrogenase [quinone] large subunit